MTELYASDALCAAVVTSSFSNDVTTLTTSDMASAAPDAIRSAAMPRHPLSAAERTARVLRDNTGSRFCTPIAKTGDTKTTRGTGIFGSV